MCDYLTFMNVVNEHVILRVDTTIIYIEMGFSKLYID